MAKYSTKYKKHNITSTRHELGDFNIKWMQVDPKTIRIETPRMVTHRARSSGSKKTTEDQIIAQVQSAYKFLDDRDG